MPRVVDQDQKRETIAKAAYEVIARGGIGAATMRSIARAAGCSTGMLVHYFRGKQDVLLHAHNHSAHDVRVRMRSHEDGLHGLELLLALIIEVLPMDARRRGNWVIWMSFWDPSLADTEVKSEQARRVTEWRRRLKRALSQAKDAGQIHADIEIEDEVDRVAALLEGLAIQVIVHGRQVSGPRQLKLVNDYLQRLATVSLESLGGGSP